MLRKRDIRRKKISMKKYNGKKVLLIDGGSRQVLPLIKEFGKLQCDVSVYCGSRLDVGYVSKYTQHRILGCFDIHKQDETFHDISNAILNGHFDIVIPMNDFAAALLAKHKPMLSKFAYICVNDWPIFHLASDKLQTMRICMEENIPCPQTVCIEDIGKFDFSKWKFPLVIKPRSGYGANGFSVVNSMDELKKVFDATQKKFGPALVQEYVPQSGQQYQVEMFMDQAGVCKSFVLMDKLRWYPLSGGSSTLNVTVKDDTIKRDCIQLLSTMNWHGYASLDLIRDPRDEKAKILEVNPRINGTIKICFYAGVNMALQHLQDAFGDSVTDYPDYKEGIFLRYIHTDVLWFLKSKDRFRTKPSWFSWKNTTDEILSFSDMRPFLAYSITAFQKLAADKKKRGV